MDLHLDLDAAPGRSLRARVEHALREAVRALPPGTRLPPTRGLSVELGISRGVVVDAYAQLAAEGYLVTRRGGGTTVAGDAHAPTSHCASVEGTETAADDTGAPAAPRYDLRPALPSVDGFPRAAWAAALTRVIRTVPDERLGYSDPFGEPELRAALAAWLGRRRGVRATPQQVVITGGVRQGLPLTWALLHRHGVRAVAFEHPGWRRVPDALAEAGFPALPVQVDDAGVDPTALAQAPDDVRALAITPAHHFPTGAVLSAERRGAIVAWARERDAFLIEDDYDAEYRYDRQPVGSLQGLAPDRVLHSGSASKALAPALRLGWLVLPPILAADLDPDRGPLPAAPPPLDQLAFAELLLRGDVDRHLRRQRTRYRRRREALLDAVAHHLPHAEVRGAAAGLFVVLVLPGDLDERNVVAAAAQQGVALEAVGAEGTVSLAVGYANLQEAAAQPAAEALARAIDGTVRAPTTGRRRAA